MSTGPDVGFIEMVGLDVLPEPSSGGFCVVLYLMLLLLFGSLAAQLDQNNCCSMIFSDYLDFTVYFRN